MKNDTVSFSPMLMYLAALFVSFLLISNVLANRMILVFGLTLDAGTLTFPITYILSDIFSEVYGYKWSRRIAWTSLAINAVFSVLVILVIRMPMPEWHEGMYFANALGNSWRIVVASLIAYCIGDLADDRVFRKLRAMSQKKHGENQKMRGFVFRALTSSLVGHILDSNIFVLIAFLGVVPTADIPGMILITLLAKWLFEIAVIPITYKLTNWVRKKEYSERG